MLNGLTTHRASLLLFWVAILVPFEYTLETIVRVSARHHYRDLLTILADNANVIIVHLLLLHVHPGNLLFDVETERDAAPWLIAEFGVGAGQGDELLAEWAVTIGLALAVLGVNHNPLHLPASSFLQLAVCVMALSGVHQGLDTPLDGDHSFFRFRAFTRSLCWPLKSRRPWHWVIRVH